MLVQDSLTGYVHEVPDRQLYEAEFAGYSEPMSEGQVVYDGLGNPVGFLKWIKKAVRKVAPLVSNVAPFLPIPGAGALTQVAQRVLPGLVQRFAPAAQRLVRALPAGVAQQFAPVVQAFQQAAPAMMQPPPPAEAAPPEAVEGFYAEAAPVPPAARVAPAMPGQPVRRLPPGWIRRPVPFQGTKGRRVYLRCALWPGPKGLIPTIAAQAPAIATVTAPAPVPAASLRRGPRRVYRRRR
jgi:hypothetical protein